MGANNRRLDDGFSTIITMANLPGIKFYEKSVTPPGIDGGGPIDTTTMRNVIWRTMAAKALKTLTPVSVTVAWATDVYPDLDGQINVNQLITLTFPDDSSISFYGYLNSFQPGELTEGNQPTATVSFQPTNQDLDGVEAAPIYDASGSSGVQS